MMKLASSGSALLALAMLLCANIEFAQSSGTTAVTKRYKDANCSEAVQTMTWARGSSNCVESACTKGKFSYDKVGRNSYILTWMITMHDDDYRFENRMR
jgi:hypothetical protein